MHLNVVTYKNTEFFVNVDEVKEPAMGHFLEIKSKTWSRKDADNKAKLADELLELLGASNAEVETQDLIEVLIEK